MNLYTFLSGNGAERTLGPYATELDAASEFWLVWGYWPDAAVRVRAVEEAAS